MLFMLMFKYEVVDVLCGGWFVKVDYGVIMCDVFDVGFVVDWLVLMDDVGGECGWLFGFVNGDLLVLW